MKILLFIILVFIALPIIASYIITNKIIKKSNEFDNTKVDDEYDIERYILPRELDDDY